MHLQASPRGPENKAPATVNPAYPVFTVSRTPVGKDKFAVVRWLCMLLNDILCFSTNPDPSFRREVFPPKSCCSSKVAWGPERILGTRTVQYSEVKQWEYCTSGYLQEFQREIRQEYMPYLPTGRFGDTRSTDMYNTRMYSCTRCKVAGPKLARYISHTCRTKVTRETINDA